MFEIDLKKILNTREKREKKRKELIEAYKMPLLVFTLNAPGSIKTSLSSNIVFNHYIDIINKYICIANGESYKASTIIYKEKNMDIASNEYFVVFDANPQIVKNNLVKLEDQNKIGRLFDIDIYDATGTKLSRNTLRKCYLCEKPAFDCARNKTHSFETLSKYFFDLIDEETSKIILENLGLSLYDELSVTPKPGLVDRNNNGSHKDLTNILFYKSIDAIINTMQKAFMISYETYNYDDTFAKLKNLGILVEKAMFTATNNINTYKGIVYLSLITIGALAKFLKNDRLNIIKYTDIEKPTYCDNNSYTHEAFLYDSLKNEIQKITKSQYNFTNESSNGSKVAHKYNVKTIREEASDGLPSVFKALEFINKIKKGHPDLSNNDIYVYTLLYIMTILSDTNLYHRGGIDGYQFAKNEALKILASPSIDKVYNLDKMFILKNLSPGGSADILAISIFIKRIVKLMFDS